MIQQLTAALSGIFFSKDRREEVIEVEEDAEMAQLPGFIEGVKIMTQGQWMKGCPEGSEQSFLFQLYSKLTDETPQLCPQGCGATYTRSKSDFFGFFVRALVIVLYNSINIRVSIQPDFTSYILHVRAIVRKKCPRCHSEFCTACDEPISSERTHRPGAASDDNVLFHCSNLQGVILGIGLGILEQQFVEDTGSDGDSSGRTTKRRKTSPNEEGFLHQGRGTRAKGGTGYAGDQKEDVGHLLVVLDRITVFLTSSCLDVGTAGSIGCTESQGWEDRKPPESNSRVSPQPTPRRGRSDKRLSCSSYSTCSPSKTVQLHMQHTS
jgi:hypothetical protein